MKFNKNKFKQIRKQQRWSLSELAKRSNISRISLSNWENGKTNPSEKKIRELAHFLNISVSEISNLETEHPISSDKLSSITADFISFADFDALKHKENMTALYSGITKMDKSIKNATTIINALTSSMHSIFYVKDNSQKYIMANKAFLNISFLNSNFNVLGKTDKNFFPSHEAVKIFNEDREVLLSCKPIVDREDYIPGTRKKRWGLISKIPILDKKNQILGIAGIIVDITERKKSEEQRLALINAINQLKECIWVAKVTNLKKNKYKVVYINDAIEKMSGAKKENFISDPELWMKFIHPKYKNKIKELRSSLEFPRHYQYKAIRQDTGEEYWRDDVTYKDGDIFFGIARDMSTLKQEIDNKLNNIAVRLLNEGVEVDVISKALEIPKEQLRKIKTKELL